MANHEAVRGYVLEELLARLLQGNGYRLLVSAAQDPDALSDTARGLAVHGRGADHQADVLGELDLPLPFSLPMRLFVEAKYRGKPTGLDTVRNACGTIHDVNEHYGSTTNESKPTSLRRYHYRYALFSASGFSAPAQRYALAQQISLIDLSNSEFGPLLTAADQIAGDILATIGRSRVAGLPLRQIRAALRIALGTWPRSIADPEFADLAATMSNYEWASANSGSVPGVAVSPEPVAEPGGYVRFGNEIRVSAGNRRRRPDDEDFDDESYSMGATFAAARKLSDVDLVAMLAGIRYLSLDDLILGFPQAPFVLVFVAHDPQAFTAYVDSLSITEVPIKIEPARRERTRSDWTITPADGSHAFRLEFTLPNLLAEWMLERGVPTWSRRAIDETLFSSIAILRGNRIVRLTYSPHQH